MFDLFRRRKNSLVTNIEQFVPSIPVGPITNSHYTVSFCRSVQIRAQTNPAQGLAWENLPFRTSRRLLPGLLTHLAEGSAAHQQTSGVQSRGLTLRISVLSCGWRCDGYLITASFPVPDSTSGYRYVPISRRISDAIAMRGWVVLRRWALPPGEPMNCTPSNNRAFPPRQPLDSPTDQGRFERETLRIPQPC